MLQLIMKTSADLAVSSFLTNGYMPPYLPSGLRLTSFRLDNNLFNSGAETSDDLLIASGKQCGGDDQQMLVAIKENYYILHQSTISLQVHTIELLQTLGNMYTYLS
jgi:hypothetical protein